MFFVYILQSLKTNRFYIGCTNDLDNRLVRHNRGVVKSTKGGVPWKVLYTEEYASLSKARRREVEIKKFKGGIKFQKLLGTWRGTQEAEGDGLLNR